MSYRPTIGGRLRERAPGVDRSQAACCFEANDLVKEIGQTCGLNVIMRRSTTSHRSVVTAAKLVYSTWKFRPPGERNAKTIYRDRLASQSVHLLHSVRKRQNLYNRVGAGRPAAVCKEIAAERRNRGGDHLQHAFISRCGGAACNASGGGGYESVSGDQPIGEENRSQRCQAALPISVEGFVTGGAHEE